MALFWRLGIPAPREAHARLYVNNEYAGLYVIVESVDKRLLARVFGAIDEDTQNDGFLFEFNWENEWHLEHLGDELGPYKERFDAKTHESKSDEEKYRPIEELVRLANETREDRLIETISPLLDVPAFIRYVAAQNFVAEIDGVLGTWGVNNFYLYRLENRTQHVFIAWDDDVAFWGPTFPTNEGHDANVLMNKLMRLPEVQGDVPGGTAARHGQRVRANRRRHLDGGRDPAPAGHDRRGDARGPAQAVRKRTVRQRARADEPRSPRIASPSSVARWSAAREPDASR